MYLWVYIAFILRYSDCATTESYTFFQSDYYLRHDRAIIDYSNSKYVVNVSFNATKFNRSAVAYNFRFKLKELVKHDEVTASVNLYRFRENEYKFTGLAFPFNVCEALKQDYLGFSALLKQSNIPKCPIRPGTYYVYNSIPDESKFPPRLPYGQWRADIITTFNNELLCSAKWYGSILPKKKKIKK